MHLLAFIKVHKNAEQRFGFCGALNADKYNIPCSVLGGAKFGSLWEHFYRLLKLLFNVFSRIS